jgi:hypothetical protein
VSSNPRDLPDLRNLYADHQFFIAIYDSRSVRNKAKQVTKFMLGKVLLCGKERLEYAFEVFRPDAAAVIGHG